MPQLSAEGVTSVRQLFSGDGIPGFVRFLGRRTRCGLLARSVPPVAFALAWGGLATASSFQVDPAGPPQIKATVDYVRVPVAALDEQQQPILDLTAADFSLFDEGEPKAIENFVLDVRPVHVFFLLDASGSTREELPQIRYATVRFAQHFSPEDRMAAAAFSDGLVLLQDWTDDFKRLRKSLKRMEPGYRTALWDSLAQVVKEKLAGLPGKRAVILVTDGLDNESSIRYADLMQLLTRQEITLYIVSRSRLAAREIEGDERVQFLDRVMRNLLDEDESFVTAYFRDKEAALETLAAVNGGRVFYPPSLPALGQIYVQIARELKTQYVLTFPATTGGDKEYRRIRVECRRPVSKLVYRRMYYAK